MGRLKFSVANAIDARGLAAELALAFGGDVSVSGNRDHAEFRIDGERYVVVRGDALPVSTAYRDVDLRQIWYLDFDGDERSEIFASLRAFGADDVKPK